jgi:polar amino acid transport system substrate-binding protein
MVTDGWTRRDFFRRAGAMGAAAACWMSLSACGGGDGAGGGGELPPKDEPLTIGIANEQPFGYQGDDGKATGFAPDVARAVLDKMGYSNYKFEVVEFGQLIGGLQAGQFDLVAAGMYITPERLGQILFSDPDYCISESLAVPKGNPKDIVDYTSFVDNKDLTIAVASGTVEVDYAKAAGIAQDQIKPFAGINQMYAALEAGEVDAVTGTEATVRGQVKSRKGLEAVEGFIEGIEPPPCGGYGFKKDNNAFRDAFNEQLNKLREDGTTKKLIAKYEKQDGPSAEDVEKANKLTVADFEKK